jgi:hypothetical protein
VGRLVIFLVTGTGAAATVAFRRLSDPAAMLAGCLFLLAGAVMTLAAIQWGRARLGGDRGAAAGRSAGCCAFRRPAARSAVPEGPAGPAPAGEWLAAALGGAGKAAAIVLLTAGIGGSGRLWRVLVTVRLDRGRPGAGRVRVVLFARPDVGAVIVALLVGLVGLVCGDWPIVRGAELRRIGQTRQPVLPGAA